MDKYAIIKAGSRQHLVSEGQILLIDKIKAEKDQKIQLPNVLLVKNNSKVEIGTPILDTKVEAIVLDQTQGKKLRVSKFKAKTGYRKTIGFRAQYTRVKIDSIGGKAK